MTPRQRKFCDEYLISGNATDAAIKAGYSPKTAKQTGSENLAKPDLKAYIETELEKLHSAKIADAEEAVSDTHLLKLDGLITGEDLDEFEAFDLYDFKYSNNAKNYAVSGQLHEYK